MGHGLGSSQAGALLVSPPTMATDRIADRLDTIARVDSPEQVRFEYRVAGPARRALAYIIDLLIRAAVVIALSLLLLMGPTDLEDLTGASTGILLLVAFVIEWGYYVAFETLWDGSSPGKRAMRLRVVKEGGHPINFMDALLRSLLRAADFLPSFYAAGVVVMCFDSRFRRLGDLVASTMVVVEDRLHLGDAIALQPPVTAEELAAVPATVRLEPAERDALDLFVRRLDRLSPERAAELADLAWPALQDRLPAVPSERRARWLAVLYVRATQRAQSPAR